MRAYLCQFASVGSRLLLIEVSSQNFKFTSNFTNPSCLIILPYTYSDLLKLYWILPYLVVLLKTNKIKTNKIYYKNVLKNNFFEIHLSDCSNQPYDIVLKKILHNIRLIIFIFLCA
jgi:hypothetical protein